MEDLFERAAASTGAEYVEAERQLRQRASSGLVEAEEAIRRGGQSSDPLTRLLAEVLLSARGDAARDYENLEKLFENLPAHTARTPLGTPSPSAFASILARGYGNRATKFLALRLVKEPDWPNWQAIGALLYLQGQRDPATTAAILRFMTISAHLDRRIWARDALAKIADPTLAPKVDEARGWAKAHKLPLPPELADLASDTHRP